MEKRIIAEVPKKSERLSIRITPELKKVLHSEAKNAKVTVTTLVTYAIITLIEGKR